MRGDKVVVCIEALLVGIVVEMVSGYGSRSDFSGHDFCEVV